MLRLTTLRVGSWIKIYELNKIFKTNGWHDDVLSKINVNSSTVQYYKPIEYEINKALGIAGKYSIRRGIIFRTPSRQ